MLSLLVALLVPARAWAHAVMIDPPPRDPDLIKVEPCGGAGPTPAGAASRTRLVAGSTITVHFQETVQHPGYFRIAFTNDGLTGFDQHVLVPMIADGDQLDYTAEVTLPDTPCDSCSLQLIQCMDGALPPVGECFNYYSCSDIVLTGPGGGGGAADASVDAGGGGDADAGPLPPDAASGNDPGDPSVGAAPGLVGACSVGGRGHGPVWPAVLLLGLPFLFLRRRVRGEGFEPS